MASDLDKLTERIIRCVIRVHQTLGRGFAEKIYRGALLVEFGRNELNFEVEKRVDVYYEGVEVGFHRLDIVVDNAVILELKAAKALAKVDYDQLRSYLKATGLPLGLLINFGAERADFRRVQLLDVQKPSPYLHPLSPISP